MEKRVGAHLFVFGYTFFIIAIMVIPSLLGLTGEVPNYSNTELLMMKFVQVFSVILLFIAPALLYAFLFSEEKMSTLKLNNLPVTFVGLIAITFILALPAINIIAKWNATISFPDSLKGLEVRLKTAETAAENMTLAFLQMETLLDLVVNLIVIALAAAVSEEFFFRGVLQTHILKITKNIHVSVWIAAIVFSAIHGQFFGFFPRMILGAMLGYFFVYSGSLWIPIIGHFINNGLQVVVTYFMLKSHSISEIKDMDLGPSEWWIGLISAFVTVMLMYLATIISKKSPIELPKTEI